MYLCMNRNIEHFCKQSFQFRIIAAAIGALLVATSQSYGAPIRFEMTGTIDVQFLIGELPEGVYQGAPFTAYLSYDTDTPDLLPDDPLRARYSTGSNSESELLLIAGATHFQSRSFLSFYLGNDVEDDIPFDQKVDLRDRPGDVFSASGGGFDANFDHLNLNAFRFNWHDPFGLALSSEALPTRIDVQGFEDPFIEISTFEFDSRIWQFTVHANVESIRVVPEPGAFSLLFLGSLLIAIAPHPVNGVTSSYRDWLRPFLLT